MHQFAQKIASVLRDLDDLETLSVKVASDSASSEGQAAQSQSTNILYDVIKKEAGGSSEIVILVEKMAKVLGKPEIPNEFKAKLAAAVVLDDTLAKQEQTEKVASMTLYGREYVADLLKGVLV